MLDSWYYLFGLSTATKPTTVPPGSIYVETDTGLQWIFAGGTTWVPGLGSLLYPVEVTGTVGVTQGTNPWLTAAQAATSGGVSAYSFLSTAAVIAAAIKASAGQVYALHFFNNSATIAYVRLYNQATAPGTGDSPVYRALVPANANGAGYVVPIPPGVVFSAGIGIRVTAGVADNNDTALTANTVLGNVFYK